MSKDTHRLSLDQPASYQIIVVGHLSSKRAAWFEDFALANEYDEEGNPITVMTGEVLDQAMLHGLLIRVRDLGLPLLAVNRVVSDA